MTNYPDSQDNIFTLPTVSGDSEEAIAINALQEAVLAIEEELGIKPSGIYSNLKNKLDIIENRVVIGGSGSYDGYVLEGIVDDLITSLPRDAAQTLADTNATLNTTARRSQGPITLTANRTYTIPNGTVIGERRVLERRDKTFHEERYVSVGGIDAAVINRPGIVEIEWNGTSWKPVGDDIRDRTFYPEDYGNNVGNGDADADTAAIQAMFDAILAYPGAGYYERQCARAMFRASTYLINQTITVSNPGSGFMALVIDGIVNGRAQRGTMLEWDGDPCAYLTGSPTIQFVAASGKLIRTVGSWISDGFEVGQQIIVQGAGTTTNSGQWEIEAVTALELTVSDGYQSLANEGPVAGVRVLQLNPVLLFKGCHGVRMSRMEIDAKNTASHCCVSSIDVNATPYPIFASGNRWHDCYFHSAYDHRDAAEFGVGRINQPGSGSQCDTHMWQNCGFQRWNGYSVPTGVRGVRFYDAANTEGFTFLDCEFGFNKVHVEGPTFSNFYHCQFESSYEWDAIVDSSAGFYSCQSEHRTTGTGSGFIKVGALSPVTVVQHIWQGILPDGGMGIESQGQLTITGGFFYNFRNSRDVISVNAAANTVTTNLGHRSNLLDGYEAIEFIVDQAGNAKYPKGVEAHVKYYPYNIDNSVPNQQTFNLSTTQVITLGGPVAATPVDFVNAGSGAMFLSTPFHIVINGKGTLSVENTHFLGSVDWIPARNAIVNPDFHSPYWNRWVPSGLVKIHTSQNTGGFFGGYTQELRDGDSKHTHALALQPWMAQTSEWRLAGAPLSRGVACVSIKAVDLVSQFPVIYLPPRARLVQVLVEVVAPFAGTGPLTAMTVDIYDQAGSANDYFATPVNLMAAAGTWFGLLESEMGTLLAANPRGYARASTFAAGQLVQVVFNPTGGTIPNLTSGQANIYFVLDQFPDPRYLGAS